MKKNKLRLIVCLFCCVSSAFSHHSLSAEFNRDRSLALTGVVTAVGYSNPHSWFYLDVKESESGKIKSWSLQLPSPNMLGRLGWIPNLLKSGDTVSINGYPAKDGSRKGSVRAITLTDGRKVVVAF